MQNTSSLAQSPWNPRSIAAAVVSVAPPAAVVSAEPEPVSASSPPHAAANIDSASNPASAPVVFLMQSSLGFRPRLHFQP